MNFSTKWTGWVLGVVALLTCALSVYATLMLCLEVFAYGAPHGSIERVYAVGVALAFELAKLAFLWSGLDLSRSLHENNRVLGRLLLGVTAFLFIVSLIATAEFLAGRDIEARLRQRNEIKAMEQRDRREQEREHAYRQAIASGNAAATALEATATKIYDSAARDIEAGYVTRGEKLARQAAQLRETAQKKRDEIQNRVQDMSASAVDLNRGVGYANETALDVRAHVPALSRGVLATLLEIVSVLALIVKKMATVTDIGNAITEAGTEAEAGTKAVTPEEAFEICSAPSIWSTPDGIACAVKPAKVSHDAEPRLHNSKLYIYASVGKKTREVLWDLPSDSSVRDIARHYKVSMAWACAYAKAAQCINSNGLNTA